MTSAQDAAERARERTRAAGARALQLSARRADLAGGEHIRPDQDPATSAARHLELARERASDANESLRRSLLRAAEAHERTAGALDLAAERGTGDLLAHRRHATEHRANAVADRERAAGCVAHQLAPPATRESPVSARRSFLWRRLLAATRRSGASVGTPSAVAQAATQLLGDVDAMVITLRGSGLAQHELAATGPWGHHAEELQYTTGEGPSVTAFAQRESVTVADLADRAEVWPGFVHAAAEHGVGAVFAFPLTTATAATLGTMTLYRREPGSPSADLTDARLLAPLLAAALLAGVGGELVDRITGSPTYEDVNVAVGMLSAEQAISTDEAMLRLRATAFTAGRPLTEAAREVLARHLPPA